MDKDLSDYEHMWTTELNDYWLIRTDNSYLIYHAPTTGTLIIEDDKDYRMAIRKLKQAGARVTTTAEIVEPYLNDILAKGIRFLPAGMEIPGDFIHRDKSSN